MTTAQSLSQHLTHAEVNVDHTEAVLHFNDGSRLWFCHTVEERKAKAFGLEPIETESSIAGDLLAAIARFRLNRKHLDIQFHDASCWDEPLR